MIIGTKKKREEDNLEYMVRETEEKSNMLKGFNYSVPQWRINNLSTIKTAIQNKEITQPKKTYFVDETDYNNELKYLFIDKDHTIADCLLFFMRPNAVESVKDIKKEFNDKIKIFILSSVETKEIVGKSLLKCFKDNVKEYNDFMRNFDNILTVDYMEKIKVPNVTGLIPLKKISCFFKYEKNIKNAILIDDQISQAYYQIDNTIIVPPFHYSKNTQLDNCFSDAIQSVKIAFSNKKGINEELQKYSNKHLF